MKQSNDYRSGVVEETIRCRLALQIAALRESKNWDRKEFAAKLGIKLSWVYRLEDPNEPLPTIRTLLRIAEVFDVGLDVRFDSFANIANDIANLTPESFSVPVDGSRKP